MPNPPLPGVGYPRVTPPPALPTTLAHGLGQLSPLCSHMSVLWDLPQQPRAQDWLLSLIHCRINIV